MRVHAIEHPNRDGRWLINRQRPCSKPADACDLEHLHVFTDVELANHELYIVTAGIEAIARRT